MTWQEVEAETVGYLYPEEGPMLSRWAERSPGLCVEIGSFAGKSLLWIAAGSSHPVVSIDHHRGNPEMQKGNDCFVEEAWDETAGCVDSLPLLRRTLAAAGFESKVTVIGAPSAQVAEWWSTPVGFLFIDGDHGPGVLDDYRLWSPHLLPDAVLCFHDTAIPDIAAAVGVAVSDGWSVVDESNDCLRVMTR